MSRGVDLRDEAEKLARQKNALENRGSVSELFDVYIRDFELDGKRSALEVRRIYGKDIEPVIGGKLVAAAVTTDDLLDVLTPTSRVALKAMKRVRMHQRRCHRASYFIASSLGNFPGACAARLRYRQAVYPQLRSRYRNSIIE